MSRGLPERCVDGAAQLSVYEIASNSVTLDEGWVILGTQSMTRRLKFLDFKAALAFVNAVGEVAESENHHPDLALTDYCHVTITLSTHDAGGITGNDFVIARHADALWTKMA